MFRKDVLRNEMASLLHADLVATTKEAISAASLWVDFSKSKWSSQLSEMLRNIEFRGTLDRNVLQWIAMVFLFITGYVHKLTVYRKEPGQTKTGSSYSDPAGNLCSDWKLTGITCKLIVLLRKCFFQFKNKNVALSKNQWKYGHS